MEATRDQILHAFLQVIMPMLQHNYRAMGNIGILLHNAINQVSIDVAPGDHPQEEEANPLERNRGQRTIIERIVNNIEQQLRQPQQQLQQPGDGDGDGDGESIPDNGNISNMSAGGHSRSKQSNKRSTTRRRRSSKRMSRKMNKRRR